MIAQQPQQTRDGIIPDLLGVTIADIDAESPAAKSGLREGDVIQA